MTIEVPLTSREAEAVKEYAAACGKSVGQWVREELLENTMIRSHIKGLPEGWTWRVASDEDGPTRLLKDDNGNTMGFVGSLTSVGQPRRWGAWLGVPFEGCTRLDDADGPGMQLNEARWLVESHFPYDYYG